MRVALGDREVLQLFLRQGRILVVAHQFHITQDGAQRRAQLVRDEADELVLQPGELARLGHVGGHEDEAHAVPVLVEPRCRGDLDGNLLAVRAHVRPVPHVRIAGAHGVDQRREVLHARHGGRAGVHVTQPFLELAPEVEVDDMPPGVEHLPLGHAEHLLRTRVPDIDQPVEVGSDDGLLGDGVPDALDEAVGHLQPGLVEHQLVLRIHRLLEELRALHSGCARRLQLQPHAVGDLVDHHRDDPVDERREEGADHIADGVGSRHEHRDEEHDERCERGDHRIPAAFLLRDPDEREEYQRAER